MIIGIPKEIKIREDRVSLTPQGVNQLIKLGNKVLIEKNAGIGSGFTDNEYETIGADICDTAEEVYSQADIIIKVKEPQLAEYKLMKKNQIIFAYLHLAIDQLLTKELIDKKITGIAYESIEKEDGSLPVLIPMSEIAGKVSIQIAANIIQSGPNGLGILFGGTAGVPPAKVLIIGAGSVGTNAAKTAIALGANVCILDNNTDKLRIIDAKFGQQIKTYISNEYNIKHLIKNADVVIGAIHTSGYRTPIIITEEMVKSMKKNSVIIDISCNEGGIVETSDRITTLDNPYYIKHGVIHYCVDNIPSCVARSSSIALTNEILPYVIEISKSNIVNAIKNNHTLYNGINTYNGRITNKSVAESTNFEYSELLSLIGF